MNLVIFTDFFRLHSNILQYHSKVNSNNHSNNVPLLIIPSKVSSNNCSNKAFGVIIGAIIGVFLEGALEGGFLHCNFLVLIFACKGSNSNASTPITPPIIYWREYWRVIFIFLQYTPII